MPFDDRTFPSGEAAAFRRNRRQVSLWLFIFAFMVWGAVILGGVTRLSGAGLSIMEWAPVAGVLPPLSAAEWHRVFALYRTIPQYKLLHDGMGLDEFKTLFWLEWFHRVWGRLLGVVFLVPLVWFGAHGMLERRIVPRLVGLLLLIGLQGAVGWFMVASGFAPDSTAVSPYRLVVHLSLALSLFAAVLWTAFSTQQPVPTSIPGGARLKRAAEITLGLVAVTILAGGFTAGLHAGLIYNTFPLMDGRLFPEGYADLHPFLLNLFENVTAVQFDHRLLATLTAIAAWTTVVMGLRLNARGKLPVGTQRALIAVGTAVSAQYALGIATLLTVVKLPVAATHQACAVLLLASVLALTHTLRGAK